MNFLAHAYLSFDRPDILVGNMISDFVKGKKKFGFTIGIQKGIALHRDIDAFTDAHPVVKAAADIFRPVYRLYSSAFIDVAFDHFVANDPRLFTEESLFDFSQQVYGILERQYAVLPLRFQQMLPYMRSQNWLYNYRLRSGTANSFEGLVRRSAYLQDSQPAFDIFEANFTQLQDFYNRFFPDLRAYASGRLLQLDGE
ncbi:MAG TPA: ACP phosphodiesterase [Pseudobacter sp.]|nr:ACP phosphodiesterase [Pseudobacter sp.]